MHLPELRVLVLCFFIFSTGCEIRRVDSVSAYADGLVAQENNITEPEILTVSPIDNTITSQSQGNSGRSFLGIRVTPREEEEKYVFSAKELPGLSEFDVRLYAKKNTIAKDLINNGGSHAPSCRGTDFNNILTFQNTVVFANQASQLSLSAQKQEWQNAIKEAEIKDEPDFPPLPDIEDPQFQRQIDQLLIVDENFARFRVTRLRPYHFQFIELTSLAARNATLLVDATGRVTTTDNTPKVFYAHPIQLTYYFTQSDNNEWRCAHLHATYNPFKINLKVQSELEDCEDIKAGLFRGNRRRRIERCRQSVIYKYEQQNVDVSNIISTASSQTSSAQGQ